MKVWIKIMISLVVGIAAVAGLCCINLGKSQVETQIETVIERAPAVNVSLDNAHFTIVDVNVEEYQEELVVIDNIIKIPEYLEETYYQQKRKPDMSEYAYLKRNIEYLTNDEEEYDNIYWDNSIDDYSYYQLDSIEYVINDDYNYDDIVIEDDEDMYQFVENIEEIIISDEDDIQLEEIYIEVQQEQQQLEKKSAGAGTLGESIVNYAKSWVGVTPYVSYEDREYSSLEEGTDCSGFVSLIYSQFGIAASAASDDYQYMSNTTYEDLQIGDIVVYRNGGHVGIYAGDDTIIHCSNPESGTIESDMWYSEPTGYVHLYDEEDDY